MVKSHRNRILAIVLLPAFVWLMYNNAANWHLHQLSSGWIISHAHPFDASDGADNKFPAHTHNSAQLLVLNEISDLLTLAIVVVALSVLLIKVHQHYFTSVVQEKLIFHSFLIPYLRGPPWLCY
jgi:hypothetical protein